MKRLTVLSDALPSATNPYGRMLADALEAAAPELQVLPFRPRALLARRKPSLLHLHWPEAAAVQPSLFRSLLDTAALMGAVAAARVRGIPIIWTVHNLRAHEPRRQWLERTLMAVMSRSLSGWISLSETGVPQVLQTHPTLRQHPRLVTRHGHYASLYPPSPGKRAARAAIGAPDDARLLLSLGLIRPYKKVPELIRAFRETRDPHLRLILAGRPADPATAAEVRTAAEGEGRVILRLTHVAAEELPALFGAADGFVLGAESFLNSGAALLASSFGVPVLAPVNPTTRELQSELGPEALHLRWRRISPDALEAFATEAAGAPRDEIRMRVCRIHNWSMIGEATANFFRALIVEEGSGGGIGYG